MAIQGSELVKQLTGEWPVFPGHPLVVATVVMDLYPDFPGAASRAPGTGYEAALSDNRVPGAGDHVGAGLRLLEAGIDGVSIDEMVAQANRYWTEGSAGGHVKNVEAGSAQSLAIEPRFRELAAKWFADSPREAQRAPAL